MFFSVLIPVYNTSKYLNQCIESVLNQDEQDYEIVLIDDGSTDGSEALCDRYAKQYARIRVIHKQNEGLLMTRRRGFKEAHGDYCICVDSDDFLAEPQALSSIKSLILEKQCDLVLYDYIKGTGNKESAETISLFDLPDGYVFEGNEKIVLYNKLLLGKNLNPVWIKAVSRHLLDLDTDYSEWNKTLVKSQGEDRLQTFPILDRAKQIGYLKKSLYYYRWNEAGISKNVKPEYYYAYRTIDRQADFYIEKWNFSASEVEKIARRRFLNILNVLNIGLINKSFNHQKWMRFIHEISKDPYFNDICRKMDKNKLIRYYRILADLLIKDRPVTMKILMKTVDRLSSIKHTMRRRK